MDVVGLISGGKDSMFNLLHCVANGHHVVALANLTPPVGIDELDSFTFQTVGHEAIQAYAECLNLPLFRRTIEGIPVNKTMEYYPDEKDEVEDLYQLLLQVKQAVPTVKAVAVGAILSDYQRIRVENVCARLGLISLAYLWREPQPVLYQQMLDSGLEAVLIKVAAIGLEPKKHLGKTLRELQAHLAKLNKEYEVHVCGEGGEYESYTLDCPLFRKRIVLEETEVVIHSDDAFAPVGFLKINKFSLVDKEGVLQGEELRKSLAHLVKSEADYLEGHKVLQLGEFELGPPVERTQGGHRISWQTPAKAATRHGPYLVVSTISAPAAGLGSAEQMAQVISLLRETLKAHGALIKDVVQVTLYLNDMKEFANVNAVYSKGFEPVNPPSRVCVQAPLSENTAVQLDCVAYLPLPVGGDGQSPSPLAQKQEVLHVQGYSNWGPANIGPYSQAVRAGHLVLMAGQIGFLPGQMVLAKGDSEKATFLSEFNMTLRNVRVVTEVARATLASVLCGICFVSKDHYLAPSQRLWESYWGEATSPPILYVSVPHLPRSGAVEWQMFVRSSQEKGMGEGSHTKTHSEGCATKVTARWDSKALALLSATTFNEGIFSGSLEKLIVEILETIDVTLAQGEFHWEEVLLLRVFSPANFSQDDSGNFLKVLQTALQQRSGNTTVQLVPVDNALNCSLGLLLVASKVNPQEE